MSGAQRVGVVALAAALATGVAAVGADQTKVDPVSEWTGSVETEALQAIAPPAVTSAEGWGILWKAWGGQGEPPEVDFTQNLVVVTTTRGSQVRVQYMLGDDGNLTAVGAATRDLRPGFRYVLAAVPRAGVTTVNGKPLPVAAEARLAPALPTAKPYQPGEQVTGSLRLVGSQTMSQMLGVWAEEFAAYQPKVQIEVDCTESEAAEPALKEGRATLAALSRPVADAELKRWTAAAGPNLTAVAFPVCEDDVAIIVHRSNPVLQLSPEQLRTVFAAGKDPLTWGDLGLTGEWAGKPVTLHGRDEKSGTRQFLRGLAVGAEGAERAERPQTAHPSYGAIVEAVAADPNAIGYCRAARIGEGVKPILIGPVGPDREVLPYVRRTCHLVAVVPNGQPVPAAVREFLLYVYGPDGQSHLVRDGFQPVDKEVVCRQLDRLGVEDIK
jgi:phosphate transport system substrate-binding protein